MQCIKISLLIGRFGYEWYDEMELADQSYCINFFLSRYIFGGHQWWHLLGAMFFALISIGSFFEKSKRANKLISDEKE